MNYDAHNATIRDGHRSVMYSPPVMILGCGRSGTSIFGELFLEFDSYTYLSEPPFSELLNRFGEGIATKVPKASANFQPNPGLSFPLSMLLAKQPETRIFWIVRHPLDAVASLRVGIDNGWRHHPRPPDWRAWLDRPLVERCAYHWSYINRYGFSAVADLATLVRFEDMIRAPYDFATQVCSKIGLSARQNDCGLRSWARRVQDTNNEHFVEAITSRHHSRPDHSVRVGRWRENLSRAEVASIMPLIRDANRPFGYDLTAS